jgi:hypothetical protein
MTERLGLIGLFPLVELPGSTWPTNCEDVQDLPFYPSPMEGPSLLLCCVRQDLATYCVLGGTGQGNTKV